MERMDQGEVVVWRAAATAELAERGKEALVREERARAARFQNEAARREFVVGRALLRRLAGGLLGCEPKALQIDTGRYGKPGIAGEELAVNVAHAGGEVVVAAGWVRSLGVDLEPVRWAGDLMEVAEAHFSRAEWAALGAVEDEARARLFFRLWVGKEAVLKAHGGGLAVPLSSFELVSEDEAVRVTVPSFEGWGERSFEVRWMEAGTGWALALAVEGTGVPLPRVRRMASWTEDEKKPIKTDDLIRREVGGWDRSERQFA